MARSYDQHCALALALDVVGDRWALLIVRDLVLGPQRFGQLLEGLPGIGTDILTARLRDLEAAGLVSRRQDGRTRWYELTAEGRALLPAMRELAVWGVRRYLAPPLAETFSPRSTLTLLCVGEPGRLDGDLDGRYEVRVETEVATIEVAGGELSAAQGTSPEPTARVAFTMAGVLAQVIGSPLESLAATGEAKVEGDVGKLSAVLGALSRGGIVARAFESLGAPA